jgi:hypothetical protein
MKVGGTPFSFGLGLPDEKRTGGRILEGTQRGRQPKAELIEPLPALQCLDGVGPMIEPRPGAGTSVQRTNAVAKTATR